MTPVLFELIDRSHCVVSLPNGDTIPVVHDAGWQLLGGPFDIPPADRLEQLLGDLQERL